MPITGWICPAHKVAVPLDHFDSCTAVHPDLIAAILADREAQKDRTGVRVSAASACPRKYAIMAAEDVAVDPLGGLAAIRGVAWHALMEKGAEDRCIKENKFHPDGLGTEIPVQGVIAGIPITGTIDRVLLRDGKLVGQDHKTGKDARAVFIRGGKSYGKEIVGAGAPMDYKVQLNLYRELYIQQFGWDWDAQEIWWTFSAEHWCEPVPALTVEQCLTHRPGDGDYTVEQILTQAYAVSSGTVQWQDLPLVGAAIKFGPKFTACDYCDVRETCMIQAQGAPF